MFCLDSELGHMYAYNQSVGEAAHMIGWEHHAVARAAARVATVPENWNLCLGTQNNHFRRRPLVQIEKLYKLIRSLVTVLGAYRAQTRPIIFLLEWFDPVHLLALCLALLLSPRGRNWYVWILHRFELSPGLTRLYRMLHAVIIWRIGTGRLVLFSESDLVVNSFGQNYHQTGFVLPMPQIASPGERAKPPAPDRRMENRLVCWWPGQPASAKGLDILTKLAQIKAPEAAHFCLVADAGALLTPAPGGCEVISLPSGMSRAEYVGWLRRMDLALLPYSPTVYATRTSGPFADALAAGKPPVVTDGTWMAHELRQHGLDELILDWDSPTILADLLRVARDPQVPAKLARMQAAYADYHSVAGYARVIQRVFEETRQ
jgi:hypothetical protein